MAYFSIPRSGLVREYHLDGSAVDTNDGTKSDGTRTNITDSSDSVGYNRQSASFNGSSSKITIANPLGASQTAFSISWRVKIASTSGFQYLMGPGSNGIYFVYNNTNSKLEAKIYTGSYVLTCQADPDLNKWHDYTYEWSTAQGNAKLYVDNVLVSTSGDSRGTAIDVSQALTLGTYNGGAVSWYNGLMQDVRFRNAILTETERLQFWHEFNRKLGGGSDFGAYIPAPTAQFESDGSNTFVDVAAQGAVTRTAGTAATDDFGIIRAISTPNQSWPSVTGDSFVYWDNSGWKLEKNVGAVTATGINTSNTVRAVLFFPTGAISSAQQTYLENCFKRNYPYAFRRSIPLALQKKLWGWYDGTNDGTYIKDLSGNGRDLTMVSSPTKVRSNQNSLASTNGTSYAWRSGAVSFSQLTLVQWVKTSIGNASSHYGCAFTSNDSGINPRIGLRYCEPTTKASMDMWDNGSNYRIVTSVSNVNDGKHHFVAGTRNGTSANIYFDGGLQATSTFTSATITGPNFAIGANRASTVSGQLNGIHETFVFDSELTAQELQMLRFATYRN